MQLDPEIAYALGGPFTPDQVAIILSRADLTRPANDQLWALELAQLPEADRLAELGFSHPPGGGRPRRRHLPVLRRNLTHTDQTSTPARPPPKGHRPPWPETRSSPSLAT